jgi:hypothetical protein
MMRIKLRQSAPDAYINRAIDGIVDVSNNNGNYLIRNGHAILIKKFLFKDYGNAEIYCGNERPVRKVFCQLKKGHNDSHRAVIFWE